MFKKQIRFSSIITFLFLSFLWSGRQVVFAQPTVSNNPNSPHELTLVVDKTQAVADGADTITITATLKDRTSFEPLENTLQEYPPIANVQLTLQVSGAGVNLNQPRQITDANGQIKASLAAAVLGEKTITVTDPSLSLASYPPDYYQVSLKVTFLPVPTPTPTLAPTPTPSVIGGPTPTLTPTPTITVIPTPTPTATPWQPSDPIKSDPERSSFSIEPYFIGVNQTATIIINLYDKHGNRITDEVPYVTASGDGNTIIQPTIKIKSLAYFSSEVEGKKKITVRVDDVEIEQRFIEVRVSDVTSRVTISSVNPPKDNILINGHLNTPIYFLVPKDRYVENVTAVMKCEDNQQIEILFHFTDQSHLPIHARKEGQLFEGIIPPAGDTKCTLHIITQPPENPDEPEEPIEIPIEPIDPFGTIYDTRTGEALAGAVVTLFELQNGSWTIWDAEKLQQVNPQTTDESGLYSFFVYPGKYYLTVEKEGYQSFASNIIEVIKEPVKLDIYLTQGQDLVTFLWLIALLIPVGVVIIGRLVWRRERKKTMPPEIQPV